MKGKRNKISTSDIMFTGFTLFAMFFGAGNLIFPPDIGVRAGNMWWLGYCSYFIADAGFAVLAVFAMTKSNGDIHAATASLGRIPSEILCSAIILCIGPAIAIPRTAATTFELGIAPVLGLDGSSSGSARVIFSIIFFIIILLLSIRPGKIVDIIGRILTPVLLASLIILIVSGIIHPAGVMSPPVTDSILQQGISNGYQTMDCMAAMFFAIIILQAVRDKGYSGEYEKRHIVSRASGIACILLFIVYGGLAYLGASTGIIWQNEVVIGSVNQAGLLILITNTLLGRPGTVILGLIVAFACLTTAVGLVSSASEYFSGLSGGRVTYRSLCFIICTASAAICNVGLSTIISIAAPILALIYPVMILQILTVLLSDKLGTPASYRAAALTSLIVSLANMLHDTFGLAALGFVHMLPFDVYGFNWLVPSILIFLIANVQVHHKSGHGQAEPGYSNS